MRKGDQSQSTVIMSTKLFVGNLSFNATQEQIQGLFGAHGTVIDVDVIKDKFTNRPRGFGFVTMETQEAAEAAIKALNGKELEGRAITVNVARPREERAPRDGGGDRRDRRA
jgi:cold-inducible RNA-binding protein